MWLLLLSVCSQNSKRGLSLGCENLMYDDDVVLHVCTSTNRWRCLCVSQNRISSSSFDFGDRKGIKRFKAGRWHLVRRQGVVCQNRGDQSTTRFIRTVHDVYNPSCCYYGYQMYYVINVLFMTTKDASFTYNMKKLISAHITLFKNSQILDVIWEF